MTRLTSVLLFRLSFKKSVFKPLTKFVPSMRQAKNDLFSKHLLATNITISVFFSGLGDVIEQMFEIIRKDETNWDPKRTLKLSTTGLTLGVICHYWYLKLDSYYSNVIKEKVVNAGKELAAGSKSRFTNNSIIFKKILQ